MTEAPETPDVPDGKVASAELTPEDRARAERARRLAQALRDNLRRRKTPGRAASRTAN